jgi:hypothetical protein
MVSAAGTGINSDVRVEASALKAIGLLCDHAECQEKGPGSS